MIALLYGGPEQKSMDKNVYFIDKIVRIESVPAEKWYMHIWVYHGKITGNFMAFDNTLANIRKLFHEC